MGEKIPTPAPSMQGIDLFFFEMRLDDLRQALGLSAVVHLSNVLLIATSKIREMQRQTRGRE